jgi:hypothetical protein
MNNSHLQCAGDKMNRHHKRVLATVGVAIFALSCAPARAQTTTDQPAATLPTTPKATQDTTRSQALQPGNSRREERLRLRREQLQNMTPAERQQLMRQNRETSMRRLLERAGITDAATQNTVLQYVNSEQEAREKARATLRTANQKLAQAVRTGAVTEAQLGTLLDEFQNAAADEKERRAKASAELDRKVGYTRNPRLEAVLTTMGAIGDEFLYMAGGMGAGFGTPRGGVPRAGAPRTGAANPARGGVGPGMRNGRGTAGARQPRDANAGTTQATAPQVTAPQAAP